YGGLCLRAKDPIHGAYLGNGRVVLADAVERGLHYRDIGTAAAHPERGAGIGLGDSRHWGLGDDFNVVAGVKAKDLHGIKSLLRQGFRASLTPAVAGGGGAVAEFGRQGLHGARAADVASHHLVHQAGDVLEVAPAVDEGLIPGGGVGDIEVVAPAAVELGVDPVEGVGHDGQDVGAQGALVPGGVDLAGGHVFHIVRGGHRHILGGGVGKSQVDGDGLGDYGNDVDHGRASQVLRRLRLVDHRPAIRAQGGQGN